MRGIIKHFYGTTWNISMSPEGYFIVAWQGEPGDCPSYSLRARLQLFERYLTEEKFRDLRDLMRRAEGGQNLNSIKHAVRESLLGIAVFSF